MFVVLNFVIMVLFTPEIYKKIEQSIYWRDQERFELLLGISPALVSALILIITGFFSGKDEWRMSFNGLGIAMVLCFVGLFVSVLIFMLSQSVQSWLSMYLHVSIPISIALIPFIHSGFFAARYDKRKRS
jgi:hypothetical protein